MKRIFAILALLFAVSVAGNTASAQGKLPVFEPSVSYQFVRQNPDVRTPNYRFDNTTDTNGINLGLTGYVNNVLCLTAEIGANFNGGQFDSSLVTVMGGVTAKSNRAGRVQPFVRGLVGVGRERAANEQLNLTFNRSDSALSFATGAGVDFRVSQRAKLRFAADYLQTRFFNEAQHNVRLGVGVAF